MASELVTTIVMGLGTVFFGLICIIVLTMIMGAVCKGEDKPAGTTAAAVASATKTEEIPDRQAVIAAISAAIAEEEGVHLTGIRILSIKKI